MNLARRCFLPGSVILMLSGIGHLLAQFFAPTGSLHAVAFAAMKADRAEAMGMTFTLWGGSQCIGASFGLLAIFLGLQNLLTAAALSAQRALGRAATTSGTCAAAMLAVAFYFQIPPPIVFYIPTVLCFAVAAVRAD